MLSVGSSKTVHQAQSWAGSLLTRLSAASTHLSAYGAPGVQYCGPTFQPLCHHWLKLVVQPLERSARATSAADARGIARRISAAKSPIHAPRVKTPCRAADRKIGKSAATGKT